MAQLGDNASAAIRDRGAKLQSSYKCQVIMDIQDSYNRMMIQTLDFMTLRHYSYLRWREQSRGFGEITHGIKLGPEKQKSF